MRCAECGQETAEASQYCVLCGAPVETAEQAADGTGGTIAAGQIVPPARWEALPGISSTKLTEWAEWARTQSFSVTRLRPGYRLEEVDAFVEAICDTFLGIREPPLTAAEVRDQRFATIHLRPGYDVAEVDDFLEEAERRLVTWQRGAAV